MYSSVFTHFLHTAMRFDFDAKLFEKLFQVPVGTFAWILKTNPDHYRPNECVRLPLYHSEAREKILTFVDVPISGADEKKWLQAGTVLFLKNQF